MLWSIAMWIFFFAGKHLDFTYNFYLLYLAIFYSSLFIASRKFILRIKPKTDPSYGIYLWGWPIQQVMASLFPNHGIGFNQVTSMVVATIFGLASWYLIERRSIDLGAKLGRKVSEKIPTLMPPHLKRFFDIG